jgi:hypothetical protein
VLAEFEITESPAWFPLRITAGGREMTLVKLDETAYRAASFLDERILALPYEQTTCGLGIIEAAAAALAPRSHYVFHTGHAGSTLISRLIGAHEGFFSLREPALLRELALQRTIADEASSRPGGGVLGGVPSLELVLALLARTWRTNQRAVIKTTSFVSDLAEFILGGADRPAAIFMFTTPLAYLRGILAGPNSRVESKTLAPARRRRLLRRLGGEGVDGVEWRFEPRSEGEQVAMNWLCEMTVLHLAALRFGSQVRWVNFDAFLSDPGSHLQAIFRMLGAAPSSREIAALVTAPMMRQYAKAPEHPYDATLRRDVLLSADWEHGAQIKRGMEWLNQTALHYPLVRAVLQEAARASPGT